MANKKVSCVSGTQAIEISMSAAEAHEFFSKLEASLLEPAGRPNAEGLVVTIRVKLYTTTKEEISGGFEIVLGDLGETQIARLDF